MLIRTVYAILGAASVAYFGMVIRCLIIDVPVKTYRLGAEGRFRIFLVVMIYIFCISYAFQDVITRLLAVSYFGAIPILAMIPIVQLTWPVEDLKTNHMDTMGLALVYGFVGGIGVNSLSNFILILGNSLIYLFFEMMS